MSNRWLIGAAIVVAVLVVASVLIATLRGQRDIANYPAKTPEGTVQRYLQAVWRKNYQDAYNYISDDLKTYCTYQNLRDSTSWTQDQDMRVSLAGSQPLDRDMAEVEVRISQVQMGQPFSPTESSYAQRFTLANTGTGADAAWRFSEPPWPISYCPGWSDRSYPKLLPPVSALAQRLS